MSKKYWFHPKDHTGWRKRQPANVRRQKLLRATDKRKTLHDRYLEAGRKALALANVTRDRETHVKARSDAEYFFRKLKKKKK
jgi:hypothetical protein